MSRNGTYLVSGHKRGQIVLWNMNSYKKLDISSAHKGVQIVFVKFYKCSDRICILSGDMDGYVYLIEFYKVVMTYSHDF